MNKIYCFAIAAFVLLLSGCQADVDNETKVGSKTAPTFTSSFENVGTRTYVDSDLYMYWTADDRLTIFTTTYNQQYRFDGQTGANGGLFSIINTGQFVSGNPISTNYGVYPYNASTALTKEEKIELDLPAVQQYAVNSFGVGANTMVAVTGGADDLFLPFKNVCGYLVVKLYGDVTVKKVIFEGNNGEKIAGAATVFSSHNSNPEVTMSENATTSITIDCGDGIELGKTPDTATEFWFVIPPTTFSNGFTIKAMGDGVMMMKKSTTASRTIQRNIANSMPTIEAVFDTPAPIEGYVVFEDANFKAYCVANFDKDGDGEISLREAAEVTSIDCSGYNITDLEGINSFINVKHLNCSNNLLFDIELKNNNLESLYCQDNSIFSLNIKSCPNLKNLNCSNNSLQSIDVSANPNLIHISCFSNPSILTINLSNLDKIQELFFVSSSVNALSEGTLILSNTKLRSIVCRNSHSVTEYQIVNNTALQVLDLSNNSSIQALDCSNNALQSIIVDANIPIKRLNCSGNNFNNLPLEKYPYLVELNCSNNKLMSLNCSYCRGLQTIDCSDNLLQDIDVNNNFVLGSLNCSNNRLVSLDISNCLALTMLHCNGNNNLSSILIDSYCNPSELDQVKDFETLYVDEDNKVHYTVGDFFVISGSSYVVYNTSNYGKSIEYMGMNYYGVVNTGITFDNVSAICAGDGLCLPTISQMSVIYSNKHRLMQAFSYKNNNMMSSIMEGRTGYWYTYWWSSSSGTAVGQHRVFDFRNGKNYIALDSYTSGFYNGGNQINAGSSWLLGFGVGEFEQ